MAEHERLPYGGGSESLTETPCLPLSFVATSATNNLGAHLSERRRVFSFPVLREARWVAVDVTRPSYLDDATGKKFAAAYAQFRQDRRWQVVRAEDGVVVLHKAAAG